MLQGKTILTAAILLLAVSTLSYAYTGLVVDARGLEAMPGMSPRIVDTAGNEVFGTVPNLNEEEVIVEGLVGYAEDLSSARETGRTGDDPLVVRAVALADDPCNTSVIITQEDAAKVLGAQYASNILAQRKVVIIL